MFPISRDPPEGGTIQRGEYYEALKFISFQFLGIPPKGEHEIIEYVYSPFRRRSFQFLGIPPKGELLTSLFVEPAECSRRSFQFLGIPPKGEHKVDGRPVAELNKAFPISRDPPEGGT